ncbi:MAG: hypothetical protein ACPKMZ_02890 [Pleomorphochaeta sp.]
MKKIILFLLIIAVSVNLFAKDQQILPLENDIYDYIDYVYILDSKIPPTSAKPYSIGQMKVYLNEIDYNSLNKTARKYYNFILEELNKEDLDIKLDNYSSIDVEATSGLEMYSHTNTVDTTTFRDWVYDQEDRIPLLKLNLKLSVDDIFFTTSELQYMQGKYEPSDSSDYYLEDADFYSAYSDSISPATYIPGHYEIKDESTNEFIPGYWSYDRITYSTKAEQYTKAFSTNVPIASKYIDFDTPKRAIISVGGKNINFNYSRDKINWGNSILGNFIYDDHIKHNFLNLKVYSSNFNINNTVAFLNTKTSSGEDPDDKIKMFLAHRLEFMPLDFFRFAVSENVMYVDDKSNFLYFNPSYIYHNINMRGMFNAIASLETEVLLFNRVNWYSQFVLDQARAPNEDDSQSGAWGLSSGLNYIIPVKEDILSLSVEGLYTLPCLYRRDIVDFIVFDRTFVINQSYVIEPTFIGYEEGGDTVAFKIQAEYDKLNKFKALLYYSLTLKGEVDIFTPLHEENDGSYTNDGKPNYGEQIFKNGVYSAKHIIHSALNYTMYNNNNLNISNITTLSYIYYQQFKPTSDTYNDFQFSTGIKIKY